MTPEPTREKDDEGNVYCEACGSAHQPDSHVKRPESARERCAVEWNNDRCDFEAGHSGGHLQRFTEEGVRIESPAQPVPEALGEKCCTKARLDQYATDTKDLHRRIAQERQRIRVAAKTSRSRSKAVAPDLWWHGYDTACLDVIAEVDRQFTLPALSDTKDAALEAAREEAEYQRDRFKKRGAELDEKDAQIAALRAVLSAIAKSNSNLGQLRQIARAALSAQPTGEGEKNG